MQPSIATQRLILRPFTLADAADVQRLANDPAVASTTLHIPHPYPDGAAEAWINTHQERWESGLGIVCAITLRATSKLLGTISVLGISRDHLRGEMGYWLGAPYWNQGYTSEAAAALIRYCFDAMGLHRIQATHMVRNPASGRVMAKAGMRLEGTMRHYFRKAGRWEDVRLYAILSEDAEE